jgi:16S rRNA G1207 methylase RsmC
LSKRIYAERSAKTLSCLLERRPDVVYYCQPGVRYPDGTVAVDYDLYHLQQADVRDGRCAELPDIEGPCESLVMNLPRYVPMEQITLDICAASRVVSASGCFTLVMPPRSGHKRVLAMLRRTFDQAAQISRHPPVFECSGPRPQPVMAPIEHIEHHDPAAGRSLKFLTRPGLFSPKQIDRGTKLLLAAAEIPPGGTVLDVGCGYGAIGVTAAARGANVEMIDCDSRGVKLAERNLRGNDLPGRVHLAACLGGVRSRAFDVVLTNPPTHGGNELLLSLFGDMMRVCSPGGSVSAVVGGQLPLERMLGTLARVAVVAESATHRVLRMTAR